MGERGKLSWDQRPGCLSGRLNKAPEQIINNLCTKRQFLLFLYQTKKWNHLQIRVNSHKEAKATTLPFIHSALRIVMFSDSLFAKCFF